MGLHASYWEFLLRLLGLIVMADKKVYQEETEAFTNAAVQLQKIISPEMMMTRKMALDWFIDHRDRLKEITYTQDYARELTEITTQLQGLPEKIDVIRAMITIATADDAYHVKEKVIIQKTMQHWNIDPTALDE